MGRDEDLLATAPTALCDGLSSAIRVVTPSASPMTTPRGPHTPRQLLAESRQEVNQVGSLRTSDVGFLLRLLFCCWRCRWVTSTVLSWLAAISSADYFYRRDRRGAQARSRRKRGVWSRGSCDFQP